MGGLEKQKQAFRIIRVAVYKLSLDHESDRKRDAKIHAKSFKMGAADAQGLAFYDFGRFWDAAQLNNTTIKQ